MLHPSCSGQALHFVTASQNGVKHVQSYNDAHYNAGTLGNGCYILPVRDKLQASMPDSNTVRILGGDFVVCGRHVAIDGGYEEVNIDNGIPGYNRIDLLVARVETAPAEKVELKVYKGEETTGTPVVPGHVEGDLNDGDTVCEMPICSVRINGINPQAPEMLAKESIDIMALLQELRDYKSQNDKAVASAKSVADGAVSVNNDQNARISKLEKEPHVTREVSKAVSVNAGRAIEVTVTPPAVSGYKAMRIYYLSTNNPRLVISKFNASSATFYNATSTTQSGTVYFGIEYDLVR